MLDVVGARATERTPRDKQRSMGAQHFVGGVVPGVLTVVTIAKHGFLNLSQAKYGVRKKGQIARGTTTRRVIPTTRIGIIKGE